MIDLQTLLTDINIDTTLTHSMLSVDLLVVEENRVIFGQKQGHWEISYF